MYKNRVLAVFKLVSHENKTQSSKLQVVHLKSKVILLGELNSRRWSFEDIVSKSFTARKLWHKKKRAKIVQR